MSVVVGFGSGVRHTGALQLRIDFIGLCGVRVFCVFFVFACSLYVFDLSHLLAMFVLRVLQFLICYMFAYHLLRLREACGRHREWPAKVTRASASAIVFRVVAGPLVLN